MLGPASHSTFGSSEKLRCLVSPYQRTHEPSYIRAAQRKVCSNMRSFIERHVNFLRVTASVMYFAYRPARSGADFRVCKHGSGHVSDHLTGRTRAVRVLMPSEITEHAINRHYEFGTRTAIHPNARLCSAVHTKQLVTGTCEVVLAASHEAYTHGTRIARPRTFPAERSSMACWKSFSL